MQCILINISYLSRNEFGYLHMFLFFGELENCIKDQILQAWGTKPPNIYQNLVYNKKRGKIQTKRKDPNIYSRLSQNMKLPSQCTWWR